MMNRDPAESLTQRVVDDPVAMLAEGRRLMQNRASSDEGMKLIADAAHAGSGDASHLVSLMAAMDTSTRERWAYALAYLGRGAKVGHVPSQKTVAFLAGDDAALAAITQGAVLPDSEWHRLHDAIDVEDWTRIPAQRILSAAPRIGIVEGLIAPRICDWIVERARPHMRRAQIYDPQDAQGRTSLARTNSEMRFAFEQLDLVMMFTAEKIAALTGFSVSNMEPPSVLHYLPGQEFRPHYDYLDPAIPAYAAAAAQTGQRVATLLIYLSEDFDEGATDFPEVRLRFKGRKGDAVFFHNVTPDGRPDTRTLHAGLAPTRGEKWLFSQWIRDKRLSAI
jgi:hypothetical protein